jgi:2-hydroxychromene-2-carboxylate isomerase
VYIKSNYPAQTYERTLLSFWHYNSELCIDISKDPQLSQALSANNFSPQEVRQILDAANDPKYKEMLSANTKKALDYGAFGAPWFWVRNWKGEEEPFWGSDRWPYIWDFLGVPFQDIKIKERGKL